AYLVTEAGFSPTPGECRSFLKQSLPGYMIPNIFLLIDRLPLTSNGKVNRNALPEPESMRPELDRAYLAPRTPVERTLAEIWAEVLGLEKVDVRDNFFELGGDSMLSIQIITRANQAGLRLRPAQLFQYQTVAELAAEVSRSGNAEFPSSETTEAIRD